MGLFGSHHQAIADGHGNYVSQVVLALGVVVGQPAHPVTQALNRHRENPGVAFGDGPLGLVGVFLLDDGGDLARCVTHDPAIAGRIIQLDRQQTQLLRGDVGEQALQGFDFDQRHVAVENQYGVGCDERNGLGYSMTSTQLLVLQDEVQIVRRQALTHSVGTMADHHMNALWLKLPGAVDNMAKHRVARHRMKHFWQGRTHAGALTGGEDNDF